MKKRVTIIGAGIAGLSAASVLAKNGFQVLVLEKNDKPGGRINFFQEAGFTFDMGPSWYWMPQVFEDFYNAFGYTSSDFYELKRLNPSYKVVYSPDDSLSISSRMEDIFSMFESIEKGSAERLRKFLAQAKYKYEVGMSEYVWKPGRSILEFIDIKVLKSVFQIQMFTSIAKEIDKVTSDEKLRQLLKFPVLFLGATPEETPALYSLMNYADMELGTWYPMGGMSQIATAFKKIAEDLGVQFKFNEPVISFAYEGKRISEVKTEKESYVTDFVIANADYHHIDREVLDLKKSQYTDSYWNTRKMAPSSLLVFLGISSKLPNLEHHNLFFDTDFKMHAHQIYKNPQWPSDPLFYVCCPSKTDQGVAPRGMENLFLLMPIAPDLSGNEKVFDEYLSQMVTRIEQHIDHEFSSKIIYKKYFAVEDFKSTYNSFRGNAYGLANTLMQTAILKPSLKSKKIPNLFYAGQLTTPGPGLPPSIVSGQVAASEIIKENNV